MLGCLIGFLVAVLVAVLVLWVLDFGLAQLGMPLPANVLVIVRVIVGLILLLTAVQCLLGTGHWPLRL